MLSTTAADPGSGGEQLGGLAEWAVDLMERLGGLGAGLAVAAENFFPPIPSEPILALAGFSASQGTFSLAAALLWTTAGSLFGALGLYLLGAVFGRHRMYWVWERLPLVKVSDLERTEAWFERHGRKAVFFGRMIPIFRSLISIPAGIERMSLPVFVALTLAGSALWNTLFVMAGYLLGEQWHLIQPYVEKFELLVVAVVVLLVLWWVLSRLRSLYRARRTT